METSDVIYLSLALMLWTDLMLTIVLVLQWRRDREDRGMVGGDATFRGYSKKSQGRIRRMFRLPPILAAKGDDRDD